MTYRQFVHNFSNISKTTDRRLNPVYGLPVPLQMPDKFLVHAGDGVKARAILCETLDNGGLRVWFRTTTCLECNQQQLVGWAADAVDHATLVSFVPSVSHPSKPYDLLLDLAVG